MKSDFQIPSVDSLNISSTQLWTPFAASLYEEASILVSNLVVFHEYVLLLESFSLTKAQVPSQMS
jgi:hypothetical protein